MLIPPIHSNKANSVPVYLFEERKSEWVPVILCIGVLIFAPMYRWNEWKAYSRKKKMVFSIEFVIIISTIPFLLWKGNEIIDGIVMFQGW